MIDITTDILTEDPLSLTDLAKRKDVDVNVTTVWRWANRGVSGVRLETYSRGGRRFTSLPAYYRWVRQVTAARSGHLPAPQSNRQRQASISAAERELDRIGI
jgi:hypothetical protein